MMMKSIFEKEKEQNEIINGESSQTLQLLLQRSQEITIELYNQSKQIINEQYSKEEKEEESKEEIQRTKEYKMKQIERITQKKLSSLFSHRTSLTLLTFSTHLGILLNRKEHILKDINIQEVVTEPSRRIEEYCFLIENTIKTIQFDVFQRGNENEIIEKN